MFVPLQISTIVSERSSMCYCLISVVSVFLPLAYVLRRQGTVFTGVCLSTPGGGDTPTKVGTPWPRWGTPDQGRYPQGQVRMGGGGTPRYVPPSKVGTPLARSGWGRAYPKVFTPSKVGTPPPEHLLQGGRYASCIHAGGLSCTM